MRPPRIAYVLKIFPKVSETFIASELAELHRRGVELRILSLLPPRDKIRHDFIRRAGLEEMTCYEPAEFSAVIDKFRPDLLHAHFATESTAAARELAREHGLPYTFTCHGYDIYRKPPVDFGARANAAAAVITVSRANASYIAQTFGVPEQRIRIIPCGVDTSRFCIKERRGPAIPRNGPELVDGETPLLLCVARLVTVKNLGLLMRACALLKQRGVRFRCVLIGEGPCRSELEALRARLALEDLVRMSGAADQDEVLKLWQSAAVGVLVSKSEGMPVCLMEAAACGVPVVATAVGGVPELVQHGLTGLLTLPENAEDLASSIERLLRDPELRIAMARTSRARAETHFSLASQGDKLLALWAALPAPSLAPALSAACQPASGTEQGSGFSGEKGT